MIALQLRKEFAVRSLRWWIPIAAGMGLWVAAMFQQSNAVFGSIPLHGRPEGVIATISMMWGAMAIHLVNAGFSSRSSGRIGLALPMGAHRLWLTHILAIVLSGAAIPLVTAAFIALGNAAFGREPLLDPGLVSIMVNQVVVTLLVLMLAQSPEPGLHELLLRKGYVYFVIFIGLASIALVFGLNALPLVYALVPLGAAVLVGLRIYRSLPRSFTLVPREPEKRTARAAQTTGRREPAGPGRHTWLEVSTIWRNSLGNWTWLYLPVFLFYGGMLALMIEMEGWNDQAVPMIFWTCLLLCCWILVAHNKLYLFDSLPLSRRWIFAVLMLPAFALVALVYGSVATGVHLVGQGPQVDYRDVGEHRCVVVPNQYWEIAWDGRLPVFESPQGESVSPCCGQPLFPGRSALVYMPYHTPGDASPDLVAWQLSRAIETVHGQTVSQDEIRERFLTRADDGGVELSEEGRTLLDGLRGPGPARSGSTFAMVLVLFGLPALIFAALGYRMGRSAAPTGSGRWLLAGVFIAAITAGMIATAGSAAGYLDFDLLSRFAGSLVRSVQQAIPGGALAIWGIAMLLLAGGYLLAQAQFLRLEAPVSRAKN